MRTEALARSKLDDRITAILNTGREFIDFDKFDTNEENSQTNSTTKTKKIDKYGQTSPEEVNELPIIEVNGSDMPVSIIFRTNSPQINVQQKHEPGQSSFHFIFFSFLKKSIFNKIIFDSKY